MDAENENGLPVRQKGNHFFFTKSVQIELQITMCINVNRKINQKLHNNEVRFIIIFGI